MFNLLIAILGNIYGGFQNIKNGLFYDQLIEVMPENEWNDYFGIFACNYVLTDPNYNVLNYLICRSRSSKKTKSLFVFDYIHTFIYNIFPYVHCFKHNNGILFIGKLFTNSF